MKSIKLPRLFLLLIVLLSLLVTLAVSGCRKEPLKPITPFGDHKKWPVERTDTTKA